ncbi:uncharacterized protein LOC141626994 [Silene latifolia]|uniref:uncharacterized protein LOC141626994 n=1 Tax=Silene latifolia TaxID=37657 RepID=UPI003D778897
MGLAWNCRGISNALSPTIPKIRALLSKKYYDFVFIMETKCTVARVSPLFRSLGFEKSVGVDDVGASGGLWVGWRRGEKISHVYSCMNFIVLRVAKFNGLLWYLVLFYGAPKASLRASVLNELESCLESLEYPYLIVGDFNQVEFPCDKWSSCSTKINGASFFSEWRIKNELVDIPFKGPHFTWCNNRRGFDFVYERIDKALASKDWFSIFPNTGLKHYPIQIYDHAPIELDLNLVQNTSKKPYKLDAWALENEECLLEVRKAWTVNIVGSPAYRLTRKLAVVRQKVKSWTLDKRNEWNQKWEDFDIRLEKGMELAIREGKGEEHSKVDEEVRAFARAATCFWKQRAKIRWSVDGDACTKYFFNWVKGRAGRNFIYGIRDDEGTWIYDPGEVGLSFQRHFMDLYKAQSGSATESSSYLDAAARTLDAEDDIFTGITRHVTNDDADWLRKPFSAKEVRKAVFQMGPLVLMAFRQCFSKSVGGGSSLI